MRKHCSVCPHEERAAIDAALRAGVLSVESIARSVGRSRASMLRHQVLCLRVREVPSLERVPPPPPPPVRRWSSVARVTQQRRAAQRQAELVLLVTLAADNAQLRAQLAAVHGPAQADGGVVPNAEAPPLVPSHNTFLYQNKKDNMRGEGAHEGGTQGVTTLGAGPTLAPPPSPVPPSPPAMRAPAGAPPAPAPARRPVLTDEEYAQYQAMRAAIQAQQRQR